MSVQILMCPPDHYEVDYEINPWMKGNVQRSSRSRAAEQWSLLHETLSGLASIQLVAPQPGWPDMVFTANAGLVLDSVAVLSRFYHDERRGEEPHFSAWFADNGFRVHTLPDEIPFEGAGDALFDRRRPVLWAGHGFRSSIAAHPLLGDWLETEVCSLKLVDPRFYHLDTCFCPLSGGQILYYPPAFDEAAQEEIERRVPSEDRIVLEEADALQFSGNAVSLGPEVVMHQASASLRAVLDTHGYRLHTTPLDEFLKAGGAAKCLTLRTTESRLQVG